MRGQGRGALGQVVEMDAAADGTTSKSPEPSESSAEPEEAAMDVATTPHEHRSAPAKGRLWLEAIPDQAATMRLHPYCVECGAVRSMSPAQGRPLGTFLQAIANLKIQLEDNPRYPKLAQVHSHLIAKALESIPSFGDPYSMPLETQWTLFVEAVRRYRPDLDEDLLSRVLPRELKRPRRAYFDLLTSTEEKRNHAGGP